MKRRSINSADGPSTDGKYAQAVEVLGQGRTLYLSGQIPVSVHGEVPDGFEAQCRLAWSNVAAQLAGADMSLLDIVKVTTYLSSRDHAEANSRIRREVLGDLRPALTVIIAGIYDERWLLEIEAIAAA